jgi:integrase
VPCGWIRSARPSRRSRASAGQGSPSRLNVAAAECGPGFAAYLHALDPAHQIPPTDLLPCKQQRPTPYLLGGDAVSALMAAAAALRPPLHAATYQTLTGLAAVTGIRPYEVV